MLRASGLLAVMIAAAALFAVWCALTFDVVAGPAETRQPWEPGSKFAQAVP